jgi:hypothetical protein
MLADDHRMQPVIPPLGTCVKCEQINVLWQHLNPADSGSGNTWNRKDTALDYVRQQMQPQEWDGTTCHEGLNP